MTTTEKPTGIKQLVDARDKVNGVREKGGREYVDALIEYRTILLEHGDTLVDVAEASKQLLIVLGEQYPGPMPTDVLEAFLNVVNPLVKITYKD